MNIEDFKILCTDETIYMTKHAINRCYERKIAKEDIMNAIRTGEIIKQYLDDKPHPSCLILGFANDLRKIHIVISSNGKGLFFITAYVPDPKEWESDLKTRKEK